jgi:hypothetical protein
MKYSLYISRIFIRISPKTEALSILQLQEVIGFIFLKYKNRGVRK